MSLRMRDTKRGDTIIEVSLAFAIFSLVAIITVSMMNLGLSASERSLELVTARNELNAQAEALRFIHSSYVSESTLPTDCSPEDDKCQQYGQTWNSITGNAIDNGAMTINLPLDSCHTVYDNHNALLSENHAFVVNTRRLISEKAGQDVVVWADGSETFREPTLNARIIYTRDDGGESSDQISEINDTGGLNEFRYISAVEGIWIIPVKGPTRIGSTAPQYYDFYIETCWYGSGNTAPTSLDTVVRLYNAEGAK